MNHDETEHVAHAEFELAGIEYRRQNFRGAARHYHRAAKLFPEKLASWRGLASSLDQAHQYSRARRAIDEAIRLDPEDWETFFVLGNIFLSQEQFQEAVHAFEQSLQLGAPEDIPTLNNLGKAYGKIKRYAEAYQLLSRALELDPDDINVLQNIALVEGKLRMFDLSTQHYWRAGEIDPSLWGYIAGDLRALRRYPEAIEAEKNAISHDPEYAANYQDLGNILKVAGHYAEAVEQFKKAVDLDPQRINSFYMMAMCHIILKNDLQAKEALVQALVIDPSDAEVQEALTSVVARLGEE